MTTFDIFDTVITRAVAAPRHIFDVLEQRLAHGYPVRGLAKARVEAEKLAGERLRHERDPRLDEIYSELQALLHIDAEVMAAILSEELALELDYVRPHPPGASLLKAARADNTFGGFLSDMYLPGDFVKQLLAKCGLWQVGDRLWMSCETGASKHQGTLFQRVKDDCGAHYSDWTHVGDNPHSDGHSPAALGIRSILLEPPSQHVILIRSREESQYRANGALALARRSDRPADQSAHLRNVWDFGAEIAGPIVYWLYTEILRAAEREGVTDLCFLARDGQILHRLSQSLAARHGGIRCHYVAASRQAFHLAGVRAIDDRIKQWLFAEPETLRAIDVLDRLHLRDRLATEFSAFLQPHDLREDSFVGSRQDLVWAFLTRPEIAEAILQQAQAERDLIQRYFAQFALGPCPAIVDIGWGGNLQASLQAILADRDGDASFKGYYLGLFSLNSAVRSGDATGLLFDHRQENAEIWREAVSLLELIFSADHAGVTGFHSEADGSVHPVLRPAESWRPQMDWGVKTLQDAIVASARRLETENVLIGKEDAVDLLLNFIRRPNPAHVRCLSSWPCQSEQNRATADPFLPAIRVSDILAAGLGTRIVREYWPSGLRVANGPGKYFLFATFRRLRLLRRLKTLRFHR
ncbi:haloacid dehalogenase-like hydrolase [Terrimicrobium sacchariphilum]|uniref:Haloacid dehalogenase-like hydrolase n=1 Tax=Terrimicrobium sacchariphilum TaxID=690879 RepID=A0A146G2P6_TERSA|nr:hypothetical protein [Terrimicrobium sacchariphilum]GAT31762.1 haloacid dehalogenase-like hydrolase [Terrimicrobium sacchariphilum]